MENKQKKKVEMEVWLEAQHKWDELLDDMHTRVMIDVLEDILYG